jgi:hypothetical protein
MSPLQSGLKLLIRPMLTLAVCRWCADHSAYLLVQLALRISVSSTSVTVITPGAGCSITSTAAVSTTGATGCFTFRAAFFTGAGLGFAFATVRFVGFARAALRALPRLAAFPLRSLARLCTFDPFLRLAMIYPLVWLMLRNA